MSDVSRGTSRPPAADSADRGGRGGFPVNRWRLAERYVQWLAGEGVVRGLVGPREAPRLWDRHLHNCAALAELVPPRATVCDVGSGAGLPGLVLAIARPDLTVTLVEPLLRRTVFLDEVVADLGLGGVEVVRARAEALHGRRTFDVVTSRAVAPLGRLLAWSMPLVAPAGMLLAMKGASAPSEVAAAEAVLAELGCSPAEVVTLRAGAPAGPTTVVRVAWDPSRGHSCAAPGVSAPRRGGPAWKSRPRRT